MSFLDSLNLFQFIVAIALVINFTFFEMSRGTLTSNGSYIIITLLLIYIELIIFKADRDRKVKG